VPSKVYGILARDGRHRGHRSEAASRRNCGVKAAAAWSPRPGYPLRFADAIATMYDNRR